MTIVGHPLTTPVEVTEVDKLLSTLTPDEARSLISRASVSNADWRNHLLSESSVSAFLQSTPEYIDSEQNMRQMVYFLRSRGIKAATLDQIEDAFRSLRDAGLLELDPVK
jgi:hypothetical protein